MRNLTHTIVYSSISLTNTIIYSTEIITAVIITILFFISLSSFKYI